MPKNSGKPFVKSSSQGKPLRSKIFYLNQTGLKLAGIKSHTLLTIILSMWETLVNPLGFQKKKTSMKMRLVLNA